MIRATLASAAVVVALALLGTASASATSSDVVAWGANDTAQLGDGTNAGPELCGSGGFFPCSTTPVAVSGLSEAKSIAADTYHGLTLLNDGTVDSWGDNDVGQLGVGNSTGPETCEDVGPFPCSKTPVVVSGISEATAVAAGELSSFALLRNGTVMAWGTNYAGQLGDGTTTERDAPVAVHGLSEASAIAAGGDHTLALLKNGTVMAWGDNQYGELGNSTTTNSDIPVAVNGLSEVTAIAAGSKHSLALLKNGTVMAWGANSTGQLGDGTTVDSDIPVAVTGLTEATAISAGGCGACGPPYGGQSLALLKNGTVMAWGANGGGQLGDGTETGPEACGEPPHETVPCSRAPVAVSGISEATALAASWSHSLALLKNGTVMAWGINNLGQLGTGTTTDSDVPLPVDGLSEVTAISTGGHFNLAIGALASLPAVTKLEPDSGPIAGGTSVTITGSNFTGTTAVKFGTHAAESFTVDSDTSITAVSPAGQGIVPVTVTTSSGTSSTLDASFSYAPIVAKLTPNDGVQAGGTSVTITGSNFTGTTAVKFGTHAAESFTVDSDTSITAVSPAVGGGGIVNVTVIGPGGTSAQGPEDRFGYGPVVEQIEPRRGPAAGGTEVTISGFALAEATAVDFGSVPAESFTVNPGGSVTAISPPFTSGSASVPVTVITPTGTSTTCDCSSILSENYFRYAPTVTSVEPDEGPVAGGTKVTIHGMGFYGVKGPDELPFVSSVDFGSTKLTCSTSPNPWFKCSPVTFEVDSETEITATAPPGLGTVDITVETHGGTSPTTSADQFGYQPTAPAIESESASHITATDATLEAQIDPGGLETEYQFRVVASPCQANPVNCFETPGAKSSFPSPPAKIAPASAGQTVSLDLNSAGLTLEPGREYHYALIATSAKGTASGPDQTFSTKCGAITLASASLPRTCASPPAPSPIVNLHCRKGFRRAKVKGKMRCVKIHHRRHRHHRRHKRRPPRSSLHQASREN